MATVLPPDEEERLAAVGRYDVLDTPPDGAFDRITALAARLLDVPISTVTIVDADRIWFKSTHGIDVDQIDREPGLCASAIFRDAPHVVTDAEFDPRTLGNSLVRGELGLRFYVGVPLRTHDGYRLGTLNVIDAEPRGITESELATLQDLAAIVVDELELRLAARRKVELEAAREAERFRNIILNGISHEMRTPLGVLHGLAAVAEEGGAWSQEALRRHVGHLDWLVNQFIHFTALERGSDPVMDLGTLELDQVVTHAVEIATGRVPIEVETEPEGLRARADHDRTRQILVELIHNAIRFGATEVRVSVRRGQPGMLEIAVSDDGPGLDPEQQRRAFERYVRGPESPGSGIGLYVSRALAEAQGGSLEAESTPGEGSVFVLELPEDVPAVA